MLTILQWDREIMMFSEAEMLQSWLLD